MRTAKSLRIEAMKSVTAIVMALPEYQMMKAEAVVIEVARLTKLLLTHLDEQ